MVKSCNPIIYPFVHQGKFYVYDTNKNHILSLDENSFAEIKRLQRTGVEKFILENKTNDCESNNTIMDLINRGYFGRSNIKELKHHLTDYIKVLPDRKTESMILQITKKCNFKCRYCSFTNIDAFERNHASISMTWDIAKRAIDFLYEKSRDSHEIRIGFYGGEPFLEYPLMKKCITYAESIFETKKLIFYATTNGSILTEEIVHFLESHHFQLRISLDGPPSIQNKHRRYLNDGRETYENVLQNILRIKINHPDYFKTVLFNPVIFADEEIQLIKDFFINNLGIFESNITPTYADTRGFDYIFNPTNERPRREAQIDGFERKMNREAISEYVFKVINKSHPLSDTISHAGPCLGGAAKVFCSTEGKLYPCEKTTECEWTNIGNLDEGYDYKKIDQLLNICKISEEECKQCWAIRFCKICAAQCCNGTGGDIKTTKSMMCNLVKKNADSALRQYVEGT